VPTSVIDSKLGMFALTEVSSFLCPLADIQSRLSQRYASPEPLTLPAILRLWSLAPCPYARLSRYCFNVFRLISTVVHQRLKLCPVLRSVGCYSPHRWCSLGRCPLRSRCRRRKGASIDSEGTLNHRMKHRSNLLAGAKWCCNFGAHPLANVPRASNGVPNRMKGVTGAGHILAPDGLHCTHTASFRVFCRTIQTSRLTNRKNNVLHVRVHQVDFVCHGSLLDTYLLDTLSRQSHCPVGHTGWT